MVVCVNIIFIEIQYDQEVNFHVRDAVTILMPDAYVCVFCGKYGTGRIGS